MKQLHILLMTVSFIFILGCESELEDETACNPNVLAITASVSIDGVNECYLQGGLGFNAASNILSLILYSPRNNTGAEIDVQFTIPAQGYQFNESYSVSSGEYNNASPVVSGTITLTEDNYPEDPNLLQHKGTIDLAFRSAESGDLIDISGTFSFEQP